MGTRCLDRTGEMDSEPALPDFEQDYEFVALRHPAEYPMNKGRLFSNKGLDIAINEFETHIIEEHVLHSNALHARIAKRGAYHVGPLARFNLNFDRLSPLAQQVAKEVSITPPCRNPFQSIVVRAIETLYACDEALRLIAGYTPPDTPAVEVHPYAATGHGCTEAPRGILYHRVSIRPRFNPSSTFAMDTSLRCLADATTAHRHRQPVPQGRRRRNRCGETGTFLAPTARGGAGVDG